MMTTFGDGKRAGDGVLGVPGLYNSILFGYYLVSRAWAVFIV